jgi:hypothetical protein
MEDALTLGGHVLRKGILVAGIIILIFGVALFVGGSVIIKGRLHTYTVSNLYKPGEYVSSQITLNSTALLTVQYGGSDWGVIDASELGAVNSSNLASYSLGYEVRSGPTTIYNLTEGSYYIVVFSQTTPRIDYSYFTEGSILVTALLSGVGFIILIVGIIIAILGVVLKRKQPS